MDSPRPSPSSPPRRPPSMAIRLAAPLVAVSLLLLAVGGASAWYVHRLEREMADLLTHHVSSARAGEGLVIAAGQIETHLDQYLLTGDPAHLDAVPPLWEETRRSLVEAEQLAGSEAERALLREIGRANVRFRDAFEAMRRRARAGPARDEVRDLSSLVLTRQVRIPAQDYLEEKGAEIAVAVAENQRMPGRIAAGLLALGTCGAVAGLLSGLGIARGISRSLSQLSVPVHDAAGKLSEVVGPILLEPARDVAGLGGMLRRVADEVGTVVERLEQSRRETLRSEQLAALGQWAAGLAHELRNPLTSMKILVQAAAERSAEGGPGLRGRPLAVLEEEIGRMDGLLQTFLDFARPAEVDRQAIELAPLLEQTIDLAGPRAAPRSIALEVDQPLDAVLLSADVGHLRQLLLNLVLNALDASPDGGRIGLRIAADPGSSEVVIEVADEGPGLPAGLGDRIFEPFVSTKATGLGLGLSICRRIAEAHGGSIAAADRPGRGALFTVRLPADEAAPAGATGGADAPGRRGAPC